MSLTAPPVNALAIEESVMTIFAEWLAKWFDGANHVLGGHGSVPFPAATLRFQQSSLPQPLSGAGITAVWVSTGVLSTYWEDGQQISWDIADWYFLVRTGGDERLCRRAADRLFAVLRNAMGSKELSEKGIHKVRPTNPRLVSDGTGSVAADPNYVTRLVACRAHLRYPILSQPTADGSLEFTAAAPPGLTLEGDDISDLGGNVNQSNHAWTGVRGQNCPGLIQLNVSQNVLTVVELTNLPALISLKFNSNLLASLDVSTLTSLRFFECDNNLLTTLDVSALAALSVLKCANNQLTSLDLSSNPLLGTLDVSGNALNGLDLSALPHLTSLFAYQAGLTTLDITPCPLLNQIALGSNPLTQLCLDNLLITLAANGVSNGEALLLATHVRTAASDAAVATLLERNWNLELDTV